MLQKPHRKTNLGPCTRVLNMKAGAGLFAYVIQAIAFIHEFQGDQVIMKMDNKHFYYDENIMFTNNVWEYYFYQTGIITGKVLRHDNYFGRIMKSPDNQLIANIADWLASL